MSCVGNQIDAETSVFRAAIPYAVGTLTVAGVGIAVALTAASSTALLVAGIAAATFGSYAFFGVVATGIAANNSREFNANVWKGMATGAAAGVADLIQFTIKMIIAEGIASLFNRNR